MNKKGMRGSGSPMRAISLVFALILLVIGLIPILNATGTIAFSIPLMPMLILNILLVVAAIILLIDAVKMRYT
ncbi:MAG: hypothetical protein ABIB43_05170 [archaeon]